MSITEDGRAIRIPGLLKEVIAQDSEQSRGIPTFPPLPLKPKTTMSARPPLPQPGTEQFIRAVEEDCKDCAGTGRDIGALNPWDGPECTNCLGTGREMVLRNYLSEAFAIASNPHSTRVVEREHLVVVIQYARQFVSAAISLPEVA
jgi:hypothetical protein